MSATMFLRHCAVLDGVLKRAATGLSCRRGYASSNGPLNKTCLYDLHISNGGKMVDFTGYSTPVQYEGEGITDSHKHVRYVRKYVRI